MADLTTVLVKIDEEILHAQKVEQAATNQQAVLLSLKNKLTNDHGLLDEVVAFVKIVQKRKVL